MSSCDIISKRSPSSIISGGLPSKTSTLAKQVGAAAVFPLRRAPELTKHAGDDVAGSASSHPHGGVKSPEDPDKSFGTSKVKPQVRKSTNRTDRRPIGKKSPPASEPIKRVGGNDVRALKRSNIKRGGIETYLTPSLALLPRTALRVCRCHAASGERSGIYSQNTNTRVHTHKA